MKDPNEVCVVVQPGLDQSTPEDGETICRYNIDGFVCEEVSKF